MVFGRIPRDRNRVCADIVLSCLTATGDPSRMAAIEVTNMKHCRRILIVLVCLAASSTAAFYQAQTVPDIVTAANAFLASLDGERSAKARFDFDDEERMNWWFTPVPREGLMLGEMESHQQQLAQALIASTLSSRGAVKAATIVSLEQILNEIEGPREVEYGGIMRDPGRYHFSIFGQPSRTGTWGWRMEGHHISVNVTMTEGEVIAAAPTFFGSNPAEVKEGPRRGLRVLGMEEDLGRELLASLDPNQKEAAVIQETAFREILTSNARVAAIDGNLTGLAASDMTEAQRNHMAALISEYANRLAPDIAANTLSRIREAGIGSIHFAWAGSDERGEGHYYRLHGPTFLIEYDNTQNNANHVHSVFRDLENDFGRDTLRAHYEADHPRAFAD